VLFILCSVQPGQSPRFEYIVRLDNLSSPSVYDECGSQPTCRVVEGQGGEGIPQGFAKIRLQGEGAEQWAEFINEAGFLRRWVKNLRSSRVSEYDAMKAYWGSVGTRVYVKFPDWPPGTVTANGRALCHYVSLYRYFVSLFRYAP
jgi:hypothetical protein